MVVAGPVLVGPGSVGQSTFMAGGAAERVRGRSGIVARTGPSLVGTPMSTRFGDQLAFMVMLFDHFVYLTSQVLKVPPSVTTSRPRGGMDKTFPLPAPQSVDVHPERPCGWAGGDPVWIIWEAARRRRVGHAPQHVTHSEARANINHIKSCVRLEPRAMVVAKQNPPRSPAT